MAAVMDRAMVAKLTTYFPVLSSVVPLRTMGSERGMTRLSTLNQLSEAGGANQKHPLAGLAHTIGVLIIEHDTCRLVCLFSILFAQQSV